MNDCISLRIVFALITRSLQRYMAPSKHSGKRTWAQWQRVIFVHENYAPRKNLTLAIITVSRKLHRSRFCRRITQINQQFTFRKSRKINTQQFFTSFLRHVFPPIVYENTFSRAKTTKGKTKCFFAFAGKVSRALKKILKCTYSVLFAPIFNYGKCILLCKGFFDELHCAIIQQLPGNRRLV